MPATLSWCEGYSDNLQETAVATADDIDRVLDELTARARAANLPFNVDLDPHDGTHMSIVVGADTTFVEWIRLEPWCCLGSTSELPANESDLVAFAGNGQYSEIPRHHWISVRLGRDAVRHYFRTGKLLQTVRWSEI